MLKQLDDMAHALREVDTRLGRIEASLRKLTEAQPVQEWYTVRELSRLIKLSPDTVRTHCRTGRIVAQRTKSGRGNKAEYRISNDELNRLRQEGLLPGTEPPAVNKPR